MMVCRSGNIRQDFLESMQREISAGVIIIMIKIIIMMMIMTMIAVLHAREVSPIAKKIW